MAEQISIVIPTYNRSDVLERAIKAALNQEYNDIELIVVDDGSTDDTWDLVSKYSDKRDNVYYHQLSSNQGANVARNKGIEESSADFIMFLDSDDRLFPNAVKRTFHELERQPDKCAGVFPSYLEERNGESHKVNTPTGKLTKEGLRDKNVIGGFTGNLFRKSVLKDVGYLDEELRRSQDYDLYLRILEDYFMYGIPDTLYEWHEQEDRIWERNKWGVESERRILAKHQDVLSDRQVASRHQRIGMAQISRRNMSEARNSFKSAYQATNNNKYILLYLFTLFGTRGFNIAYRVSYQIRKRIERRIIM